MFLNIENLTRCKNIGFARTNFNLNFKVAIPKKGYGYFVLVLNNNKLDVNTKKDVDI